MSSLLLALALAPVTEAGTARFDHVAEGTIARSVTEDGVTVSGFDNRVDPPPGVLTSEDASETLAGLPGFSSPGVLGFGGYVPGPGSAFGQFGGLDIHGSGPADSASVEVFDLGNTGVTLQLRAFLHEAVVATDEAVLSGWTVGHHTLAIEGVRFDRLRLEAGDGEVVFVALDDVRVEARGDVVDTAVDTDPGDTAVAAAVDTATDEVADTLPTATGDSDATPDRAVDGAADTPGCGCAQGAPAGLAPLALVGALVARRRRRGSC